ncbi:MAG: DUF2807 domain-containing protein [Bacteroidia bacterium]|nr:DUF2807 domain-containing protein [Bacteroidia bacterium]
MLKQDTSKPENAEIRYGSNLMDGITTRVENGVLHILDDNKYNWVRSLKVFPTVTLNIKTLRKLTINGSASVVCEDTLSGNSLEIEMSSVAGQTLLLNYGQVYGTGSNTGHVFFRGKGTIFSWGCETGSWFDARDLECDDAYVRHYTHHDVNINPAKQMEVYIYGDGNIRYFRDPTIRLSKWENGRGRLIRE